MGKMTEKEAARLDELYTKTTPTVNPEKPGIFAKQTKKNNSKKLKGVI
jgi:hypothetical protein